MPPNVGKLYLTERSGLALNNNLLGRFFAALAMGAVLGSYIHFDYVKWGQRGREAFLAHQAHRFDLYFVAPPPTIVTVFAATVMMFGALAFYEGLALLAAKVLKSLSDSGPVQ
jgi:hypothetical protein